MVIKFIDEHTPFHVSTSKGGILSLTTVDIYMKSDFIIDFKLTEHAHTTTTSESITVSSTEESIEINSIDSQGYTPLFLAVMDGKIIFHSTDK